MIIRIQPDAGHPMNFVTTAHDLPPSRAARDRPFQMRGDGQLTSCIPPPAAVHARDITMQQTFRSCWPTRWSTLNSTILFQQGRRVIERQPAERPVKQTHVGLDNRDPLLSRVLRRRTAHDGGHRAGDADAGHKLATIHSGRALPVCLHGYFSRKKRSCRREPARTGYRCNITGSTAAVGVCRHNKATPIYREQIRF